MCLFLSKNLADHKNFKTSGAALSIWQPISSIQCCLVKKLNFLLLLLFSNSTIFYYLVKRKQAMPADNLPRNSQVQRLCVKHTRSRKALTAFLFCFVHNLCSCLENAFPIPAKSTRMSQPIFPNFCPFFHKLFDTTTSKEAKAINHLLTLNK